MRCIEQLTNEILNSPAQKRAQHQVSSPHSSTALSPPSSPTRPMSSIQLGSRLEGSLTAENHAPRCTSFAQHPAQRLLIDSM